MKKKPIVAARITQLPKPSRHNENSNKRGIWKLVECLNADDIEGFLRVLQAHIADVPSFILRRDDHERHYHEYIHILCSLLGFVVTSEYSFKTGRIDMVITTATHNYLFEFKQSGTAREALRQINSRGYACPVSLNGLPVVKIGVNFSKKTQTIDQWAIER